MNLQWEGVLYVPIMQLSEFRTQIASCGGAYLAWLTFRLFKSFFTRLHECPFLFWKMMFYTE